MINLLVKVQEFFKRLFQSVFSLVKVVLMSKPIKPFKENQYSEVVVLGNGPSLNNLLKNRIDFLNGKKKMAVNFFANTSAYEQVKPELYVLNAPEFWLNDVSESYLKSREELFNNLAYKTHWKLDIFIAVAAGQSDYWKKILQENNQIGIHYYNPTPIDGFQWFRHSCYRKYCGLPRPHNVLIPALILAINAGFKNIYVAGADHNWMKDLFVADDNTVYLTQKHFYDAQTAGPEVMKKLGRDKRKMHEILTKFIHAFKGYFDIDIYAKAGKSKIINITPNSFIDAFERKKID